MILISSSTTLYLLQKARMSHPINKTNGRPGGGPRDITFDAVEMTTSIVECLQKYEQLRFFSAFTNGTNIATETYTSYTACSPYELLFALLVDVSQKRLSATSLLKADQRRVQVCMDGLKEISRTWPVALKLHTLFETLLRDDRLGGDVQGFVGNRHPETQPDAPPVQEENDQQQKRNFDEARIGFDSGASALTISPKPSQAQNSAVSNTNSLGPALQTELPATVFTSPNFRRSHNASLSNGNFHSNTAPLTPFDASYFVSADAFNPILVALDTPYTRGSPWENLRPH